MDISEEIDSEINAENDYDQSESDEETDDIKADNLASFISSLDKKRKRAVDVNTTEKRKKQIKESTEAYEEYEYNLTTRESSTGKKKFDIQDLVGIIKEESGFNGLKQKLVSLENGDNKGMALPVPPPRLIQEKLNRQAAYVETKRDITKWEPIVRQHREAEHLKFPMNPLPDHQPTNNILTSIFQPSTTLEKEVDSILVESGVKEKDLQQYEEIQLNKLSVEEVEARRKELRQMRELMFREEIKAKRIARIKSKTYRKIRKKDKESAKLKLDQLTELDHDLAGEERLKLEAARAQERMVLKHKNTSRWAKQTLKYGHRDAESRQAIIENLQRHDELKRKIHDLDSDEELDDVSSEYGDNEDSIDVIKDKAFDELSQFQLKESIKQEPLKGIMGMKFMQDAMERERKKTQGLVDDFVEELDKDDFGKDDHSKKVYENKNQKDLVNGNNTGRMTYGIGIKKKVVQSNGSSDANASFDQGPNITKLPKFAFDSNQDVERSAPISEFNLTKKPLELQKDVGSTQLDISDNENPWLQADSSKVAVSSKKSNKKADLKERTKSDKLSSKLKKQKCKSQVQKDVEIDMNRVLTLGQDEIKKKGKKTPTAKDPNANGKVDDIAESDDDNNDVVEAKMNFVHAKNPTKFSQRELVSRAFANDNVVEEFEAEKQTVIEEDKSVVKDITLPGWGVWVGKGVNQPKNRKKIIVKPLPGEGIEAKKRQDAKLRHVIINEKRIKKSKKYLSTNIPHPFETKEQYERSLRTPLGKEWNSQEIFQKMVTPRIITKMGAVIDPLNVPFQTGDYK